MSNTQELVTQCLADLTSLKSQVVAKEKELIGYRDELKKLLGVVENGGKRPTGGGPGRPKGVASGESVSQLVLKFVTDHGGLDTEGVTRADILKAFPDRDSAVHAALRVHQQKGLIFNTTDHRWFRSAEQTPADGTVPEPVATEVTEAPADDIAFKGVNG